MREVTRFLKFTWPELAIGTASDPSGPTGCTVFRFEGPATAVVDVRGGAAALRESTLLDPVSDYAGIDALVLSGGSTYGLESASGVMQLLLEERQGKTGFMDIPSVPAAVVYDFAGRTTSTYPTRELGRSAALAARTGGIEIGRVGAGTNVSVGKYFGRKFGEAGGQGAALVESGDVKLLGVTILNAYGNILGKDGSVLAGTRDPETGARSSVSDVLCDPSLRTKFRGEAGGDAASITRGNTTISALITNLALDRIELQRLAVMAHASMARVIEPFHTPYDGDALFVVSTGTLAREDKGFPVDLGALAGRAMQEAVWSVYR